MQLAGGALDVLVSVGEGALAFLAVWILAQLLRRALRRALARRNVRADVALLTERALYLGLLALGVFEFISIALKQQITALTGVLVAAFLTSLGLQDLVKNYVAGFYVLMERNVVPGARVRMEGFSGTVTEVRLRTTYLRGDGGETIVVPNTTLFSTTVAIEAEAEMASQEKAPRTTRTRASKSRPVSSDSSPRSRRIS